MRADCGRARGLAALIAAFALAAPAGAAVIVVNSTSGGLTPGGCVSRVADAILDLSTITDNCSLRSAVELANGTAEADQIFINLSGTPTLTLDATLVATQPVQINSPTPIGFSNVQLLTGLTLTVAGGVDEVIQVSDGLTQLRNLTLAGGDLELLVAGSRVAFDLVDSDTTTTFDQVIAGLGALEKQGAGTLILTGVNTYAGNTTIGQGRLQGDTESILGGTTVVDSRLITDNGVLAFEQDADDPADFFGEIVGTGSLTKDGPGTLFLRNPDNVYAGGTSVNAGTLRGFVGVPGDQMAGSLPQQTIAIANGATLIFEQTDPGTYTANLTGSGNFRKNGAATLTLEGSNRFATLNLDQGILIGDADALGGGTGGFGVVLAPNTQLIFKQDDAGSHSGSISGGGGAPPGGFTLIKRGAQKLSLTGTSSFDGDVFVEQGELEVNTGSLPGDGDVGVTLGADTILSFLQNGAGTFGGVIDGGGELIKRGGGTLGLTHSQLFTGGTTLQGGTLEIGVLGQGDGAGTQLPGDLAIQSGTLAGIGRVTGDVDVASGGVISPGGGAADLRVGSVDFASGSRLVMSVDDNEPSDRLLVDTAATIANGSVLQLSLGGLAPAANFTRTLLTAAGSVDPGGEFTLDADFPFFLIMLDQDATSVTVHVEENPDAQLADFAQTSNQQAVAAAFDEARAVAPPGSDLETVFSAITNLQTPEIPRALADISGEQLTEFTTARLAIGERFHTSLHERIRAVAWGDGEALLARQGEGPGAPVVAANPLAAHALRGFALGGSSPALAAAAQSMSSILDAGAGTDLPPQGEHGFGAWADGYGLFGTLEGDSDTADLDYTIGGASLGVDYLIAERWLVGAAGGYAHSDLDFDGLPGSQTADTGQGALYAGWVAPWLQLGASGHFGYSAMSTDRKIRFMDRKADADFDGWDAGVRGEAALDLFRAGPVEFQPLASFAYIHVQQDEIDEDGADSLDLTADEEEVDSLVSGLGTRVHGDFEIGKELWFHPELRARWLHEFGDTERRLTSRIGGEPGASFRVDGAEAPADTGVFGVRWEVIASRRLHVFAGYDVSLASELLQHGAAAGFKFVW
jgi:outer membrane autotransporter protein